MKTPPDAAFIQALSDVTENGLQARPYEFEKKPMDVSNLLWAIEQISQDPAFENPKIRNFLQEVKVQYNLEFLDMNPSVFLPYLNAARINTVNTLRLLINGDVINPIESVLEAKTGAQESLGMMYHLSALTQIFNKHAPALKSLLLPQTNEILDAIENGALNKMQHVLIHVNAHAAKLPYDQPIAAMGEYIDQLIERARSKESGLVEEARLTAEMTYSDGTKRVEPLIADPTEENFRIAKKHSMFESPEVFEGTRHQARYKKDIERGRKEWPRKE